MSNFVTTTQYRHLRACMVCSLVQTQQRFVKEGCPNCEEMIHYRGQADLVEDCTSPVFEGLITLREPRKSWVAKWQRLDGFVRGMYAVKVSGNLPDEVILILADNEIEYRPRDGSDNARE
ncbi:transcription elongation factor spt4 [Maublancomyces gigas]|uniref:Transcription elongation factor SPT4 n=1 Tax=Discina gigas TaxID=1032678 RepID=A0ABR3GMR5_9PEZI